MNRDQLQQQVECPNCNVFRPLKQLPCQHSFCLQCLQDVHNSDGGQCVRCPECRNQYRVPASGIAGFPTSVAIQRLIEAMNQPNVPQLQLSAPPLTVRNTVVPAFTRRHHERAEDDNVVTVRAISLFEPQHQLERTNLGQQQRNQQQSHRTRTQARNQGALHISIIRRVPDNTWRCTFQNVRNAYRRFLGYLTRIECLVLRIVFYLTLVTFSRFIASAVKLGSECHDEYNVAVYSFVKACFGILFYCTFGVVYGSTNMERALNNKFVQIWLLIHALFTVIWFFLGTVWVFGKYAEMKTECPKYVEDWNFDFINLILYLTVMDWIYTFAFVFYIFSIYCFCYTDEIPD